ncbi:MAG: AMP-binding protein [Methylococcales bacterium]|nr:AMP-binding protein [Methylococcales bacterium]MBT7443756.1 AMP-binding protein [Methylococcales bacterium]
MSLPSLLATAAEHFPNHIALIHREQQYTYAQVQQSVFALAQRFVALGLQPGDRVAVCLNKSYLNVVSLFAASLAGGIIIPVNIHLKPKQLEYVLTDARITFFISTLERANSIRHYLAEANIQGLIAGCEQAELEENWQHWADISTSSSVAYDWPKLKPQLPAMILYTSGSTGQPKGVLISQQNLLAGANSVAEYLNLSVSDRVLLVLPLFFDYGFNQITSIFAVGGSVVLHDYLLPGDVIKKINKWQVTGLACVPPLFHQIFDKDWSGVSSLRYLTNSGGHLSESVIQAIQKKLPSVALFLMYGLTESFRSTYLKPNLVQSKPGSVGQAIPNAVVTIANELGRECGVGEVGELVHSGPLVSLGYWENKSATDKVYRPYKGEPAVWSGDLAKRDDDGDITIVGRRDEQIKVSGYRVSPAEIESVLQQLSSVSEVIALGVPHPILGQAIIVVLTAHKDCTKQNYLAHCQKQLPNYMVPSLIEEKTSLNKTATGKFDRSSYRIFYQKYFQ